MCEKEKCKCDFCEMSRKTSFAIEKRDVDKLIDLVKELRNLWIFADFDREYYQCILNGSWPQSEEILTKSLKKVKK